MRCPVVLFLVLLVAAPASGMELCTIDAVPAATLLLPYFDVDLDRVGTKKAHESTFFSINNASAAPALAHVVLWTDLSVPTLAFDVFLTGYDVVAIDLDSVFLGNIPTTSPGDGSAPGTSRMSADELTRLRDLHTGRSVDGLCRGTQRKDNLARGYVTIDNVNSATTLFPNESGYFGSSGVASDDNILWGEYTVINAKKKYAESENLVSIEADASRFGNGDYTFYGRYVGFSGSDNREPVVGGWGARYYNASKNLRSKLIVWRDTVAGEEAFRCTDNASTASARLVEDQVVAFDEAENPVELANPLFPLESQQVEFGTSGLPVPFTAGWIFLGLGVDQPSQSYVTVRHVLGNSKIRSRVEANAIGELTGTFSGCVAAPSSAVARARVPR